VPCTPDSPTLALKQAFFTGFWLAEGPEFEKLILKFAVMFKSIPNVEACTINTLLVYPC